MVSEFFLSLIRRKRLGRQHTLARTISLKGVGLHSGKLCEVVISPAPVDNGIEFCRTDMPGVSVPALLNAVGDTLLSTNLFYAGQPFVGTVEHIMSALAGCSIDNAIVEVSSVEIPVLDGSAKQYVAAILAAGLFVQAAPRKYIKVNKRVDVQRGDAWARLLPWSHGLQVEAEIDYASAVVGKQKRKFSLSLASYASDIAPARTFCFEQEIEMMRGRGLAKGGTLENAVVFSQGGVINPEGLRFADECVRHKNSGCYWRPKPYRAPFVRQSRMLPLWA